MSAKDKIKLIEKILGVEKIIVITPDDSEQYKAVIDEFKKAGIKGFWRPKKKTLLSKSGNGE